MRYLSPKEVAAILGFNPSTIYRAVERGNLRATKPPGTHRLRIAETDFQAWLAAGTTATQTPPRTKAQRMGPAERGRFMPLADLDTWQRS
jgi:excisionase family DNA binding protein